MNVKDNKEFFTKTFPLMMQATRILIVDHDITRYHSFDLLRYTLFTRGDLFISTKSEYLPLLDGKTEITEQVSFMQHKVDKFNIYKMFDNDAGVETMKTYTDKMREMILSEHAKITPTDISRRFDIVFERSDITGYLLQYTGEKHRPGFYNNVTVYEVENPLDPSVIIELIKTHHINAIMISSSEFVVRLIERLIAENLTYPITFIMGRYAYNFSMKDGVMEYPLFNRELGIAETRFKHEFGFFDPFGGINYQRRLLQNSII